MTGDLAVDCQPDGGDFPAGDPDTWMLFDASSTNAVFGQQINDNLLQIMQVLVKVLVLNPHNRVSDELTRTMIGRLAAPVGLTHNNASPF